jgi:hypothetical protein
MEDKIGMSPLFIGGDERSGTTYLMILLNRHPHIWISDESGFILTLMRTYQNQLISSVEGLEESVSLIYSEQKFRTWEISREHLLSALTPLLPATLTDLVLAILRFDRDRRSPEARVFGIKKPSLTRQPSELLQYFPNAKFINIVRDGRAVFNSKKKARHSETGEIFETDAVRAAEVWKKRARTFDKFHQDFPDHALEILYEEMIEDTNRVFKKIYQFVGVRDSLDVLSLDASSDIILPEHRRPSHPNVQNGPLTSRIDAWRHDLEPKEIKQFELVAGDALERKRYDLVYGKPPIVRVLQYRTIRRGRRFRRKLNKYLKPQQNSRHHP